MRSAFTLGMITAVFSIAHAAAQTPTLGHPTARITQSIDEFATVRLPGNVHPLAVAAIASGASTQVDDSTPMNHMILHLKSDSSQEAQLAQLLAEQNDPNSPLYHHFLTPPDFGSQFGVAAADIAQVTSWLQSHGFTIEQVPAGNRAIIFSGTAGQVTAAFKTPIHRFTAGGETHMGNVSDPQIPTALANVVGGIVQLHDFQAGHEITRTTPITKADLARPMYTNATGHFLSPVDFSTIYDLNSLYSAGIDGTGQSIAIVARADIAISDIDNFRSTFGLVPNDPQILIATNDPGMQAGGNSMEATLDTEWAGAVAPKAAIKLVVGQCTNSGDGITQAVTYAVNNNVAPIISVSYGLCEAAMGTSYVQFMSALWQQAAAQGQSVFVSSGDTGAAGCNSQADTVASVAGVNGLCSSPYSTCVGGTEFAEGSNPGQFWVAGNSAAGGSALSYIPETAWNESASNNGLGLIAGGGGASTVFSKPAWQTGVGVPADGKRDVPDVSLSAAQHDGYAVYEYEYGLTFAGGTSFSTPSFAGLMALVNQKAGARQGSANPVLYMLAAKQAAGGAAVFHDITAGNNSVPGLIGFSAGQGYDQATGLGSVDASLLVNHWADGVTGLSLTSSSGTVAVNAGQTVHLTITTISGLNSALTLAAAGLPAGVTATFSPATIAAPGSGSVALSLITAATTKVGSYAFTINGTSAGKTGTLSLPLTVAAPSFTLAPSKTSVTASLPSSTPVTLATTAQTGFNAALTIGVSGAPAGVTTTLSAKTVAAPGSGAPILTVAVAASATPGTYQLTVTATGGGQTQTANISLFIPTFTVTAPAGFYTTTAGGTVTFPVTTTPQPGFASTITLQPRANYLPAGITASFSNKTVSGSATTISNVTMNVAKSVPNGAYPFFIDGVGGSITQGAYEWLLVGIQGSCTLAVYNSAWSSNSMALTAGKSVTGEEVCLWPQGTFSAPLTVSFSGVPAGMTLTPAGALKGDQNPVNLVIGAAQSLLPGTYNMMISASSSGGYSGSYPFSVVVSGDSFALSGSPSALTLAQGGSSTLSATTLHNGVFDSAVSLAWSGLPTGVTAALAKSSFSAPGDGTAVTTFAASASATPGTYTATLTATGGGITRTLPVSLTITNPSCTFTSSAATLALSAGQTGSVKVSCNVIQGVFSAPLSLSVTGAPSGTTVAPTAASMPATGSASIQVTTPITMAATNFTLSVMATSGAFTATIPVAVSIAASNFTLTTDQSALTIAQAASAVLHATVTHHGVFDSAVTLTWSGLPAGISASPAQFSLAAPGDATVATTFKVTSTATAGAYTATLTASGGGLTQTVPLKFTITAAAAVKP